MIQNCLMADCPYEFYWFDKTQGLVTSLFAVQYSVSGGRYVAESLVVKDEWTFSFTVADAYAGSGEYTTDSTKTGAASAAAAEAQEIVADNEGKSDYEKLVAYKDKICELVDYNDAAASDSYTEGYGDPWQLIYVFDNDPDTDVVCEGYSKAFQYLCNLSTFEDAVCYTVGGYANGGAHMWNIVTLEGANYLVDVTNSDTDTVGQDGELFLAGTLIGSVALGYRFSAKNGTSILYRYDDGLEEMYGDILSMAGRSYSQSGFRITEQPDDAVVTYGYTEQPVLSVAASASSGTVTYQWYQVRTILTATPVSGATGASFTFPAGQAAGTYRYYCVVTNGDERKKSRTASITVGKAAITVTAADAVRGYAEENPVFTFSVTEGNLVGTDTEASLGVVLSTTADSSSQPGTYAITGTAAADTGYDVTIVPGTLTVTEPVAAPEPEVSGDGESGDTSGSVTAPSTDGDTSGSAAEPSAGADTSGSAVEPSAGADTSTGVTAPSTGADTGASSGAAVNTGAVSGTGTSSGADTGASSGAAVNTDTSSDTSPALPAKGDVLKDKATKAYYTVTKAGKKSGTVAYTRPTKTSVTSVTIPKTVEIDGVTYKVTSVKAGAFKKCTKLKTITIGSNIKKIGKKAFGGCTSLKTITIKSKKLTSDTLNNKAFSGVGKTVVIKVPSSKKSAYTKLFRQKGLSKKVTIK
jgi:hypothetical protein